MGSNDPTHNWRLLFFDVDRGLARHLVSSSSRHSSGCIWKIVRTCRTGDARLLVRHHGNFDIELCAYDDLDFYEENTLSDCFTFTLEVISINDAPVLLNEIPDIEIDEDSEMPDELFSDLSLYFKDVEIRFF
mgnify:CR=1 FL=1